MRSRIPYKCFHSLALHNAILCISSLIMFLGVSIEILRKLKNDGLFGLYCSRNHMNSQGPIYFWLYIYYLSKYYELLDTLFIVLKKKPITFLHVFHHSTVVAMVWLWIDENLIYASLGMAFNTFVHIIMYYFYFLASLEKPPMWKKYITSLQIFQFVSSFLLSGPYVYYSLHINSDGHWDLRCAGWKAFAFSAFCNSTLLYLFIRFYRSQYPHDNEKTKKTE